MTRQPRACCPHTCVHTHPLLPLTSDLCSHSRPAADARLPPASSSSRTLPGLHSHKGISSSFPLPLFLQCFCRVPEQVVSGTGLWWPYLSTSRTEMNKVLAWTVLRSRSCLFLQQTHARAGAEATEGEAHSGHRESLPCHQRAESWGHAREREGDGVPSSGEPRNFCREEALSWELMKGVQQA